MRVNYEIVHLDRPAWVVIGQGITDYNVEQARDDHGQNLCFVVRGLDQVVVGGVIGATYWDWLYINLVLCS